LSSINSKKMNDILFFFAFPPASSDYLSVFQPALPYNRAVKKQYVKKTAGT